MLLSCLQGRATRGGRGKPRAAATGGCCRSSRARTAARASSASSGAAPRPASGRCATPASSNVVPYEAVRGRVVEVSGELQRDFSLHQTLSLYLVDALARARSRVADLRARRADAGRVDRREPGRRAAQAARPAEDREDGGDEGRGRRVRAAHRGARRRWSGPSRTATSSTRRSTRSPIAHPWVGQENMRPKSVAREMYEGFASFDDYVRSYGLERSEGVLLRYLSQVYKTLAETVPLAARTEEVMDILAHFRTLLRDVDTSLLEEWESMTQPGRARPGRAAAARRPSIRWRSGGRCSPRIRAELHKLVRALARTRLRRPRCALLARRRRRRLDARAARPPRWRRSGPRTPSCSTTPAARRPDRTRIDDARRRAASAPSRRWSTPRATRTGRSTASSTWTRRARPAHRSCSESASSTSALARSG